MKKILFALVALLGFIACEEEQTGVAETLRLTADNTEIYADGTQKATFTVKDDQGAVVEGATIHFADTGEALQSNSFTTKYAGDYTFYATKDNAKSNTVTIKAKEVTDDTKVVTLSVEPQTISNDGKESARFTVECNGTEVTAVIYLAKDPSGTCNIALETNSFSSTTDGEHTFYAIYEEVRSNEVIVTVVDNNQPDPEPEAPIELSASTDTIKANGTDTITFTVMQNGNDVTSMVTIYANGGKLNDNRFRTTTPGTYVIYAEKNGTKSNELTVTAEEVTSTGKSIVFAEGVTLTSGWYDVNKVGAGQTNGDIQMCWAASASNIIEWWQDRYVAGGGTLPSTAVTGPGKGGTYELALMDMYHSEWDVSLGGHVEQAIPWYFEGKLNGGEYASPGSQAVPLTDGGYWLSIWDSVVKDVYCGYDYFSLAISNTAYTYTVCYNNYYNWGNGTSLLGTERLKFVSDLIVRSLKYGMASLTVSLSADLSAIHHATTLWGYEIDNATGLVTRVWITDSDDMTTEPKQRVLHEYNVSIEDGKSHVKLTSDDVRYEGLWVVDVTPVAGPFSADN